ncbi:retrovirus-related Pol polyprotein from transposon opus [Trichonephila clavipes]|nr:retrovirus-related Pol polyprotein from transposon opus [Trichonephila clavipes]
MLDSETATHIGVLQGEEWYKPGTWANNVIYFLHQGKSYDEPGELNGMIVKREVLMVVGVNSHLGKKGANGDKLRKLVKTSISVDGRLVHALVDSGTEITVMKKDLVPGISVEGAYHDLFERYSARESTQEHIEDSQRNITSCRNEVGTLGTKDEEVTADMDKGIMVADSFRSEQECCAELALGLRADVKKFCESCKECQLTRSVRIKDRSSSTPVARPELPFEMGNMDLIGPIDPPSLKGHKYILRLVDQHTRWGEAVPLTSLSVKVTCEAWLNIFSRTEIYLLSKREGFAERIAQHRGSRWGVWEQLPAPGNRSNERRYREKGSGNDGEKRGGNEREEERVTKKAGVVKSRLG